MLGSRTAEGERGVGGTLGAKKGQPHGHDRRYVLAVWPHVGSVRVSSRHSVALPLDDQPVNEARSENVVAKALLLQQFERTERWAGMAAGGSSSVSWVASRSSCWAQCSRGQG